MENVTITGTHTISQTPNCLHLWSNDVLDGAQQKEDRLKRRKEWDRLKRDQGTPEE